MEKDKHPDSRLIDALGGTCKLADFFEITTGAVSHWRKHGMPKARKKALRYAKPKIYRLWELEQTPTPTPKESSHA